MNAALRALLTGLIDYAGLFPPAKLPMDQAVRNYLRYRDEAEGWMLGRFVCPAARLGELAAFDQQIGDRPLVVSAIARVGETAEQVLANLEADLGDVTACRQRHGGRVSVDTLEMRLPSAEMAKSKSACDLLDAIGKGTRESNLTLFFEVSWADVPALRMLHGALNYVPFARTPGYKLRAGGLEASAFPSSEQLAVALLGNYAALILFKATAGLHHPLPRFDPGVGARMHGFVNLFLAGVLAGRNETAPSDLEALLEDDDPDDFRFDDEGVTWRSLWLSTKEIEQARAERYVSFGSCSFDEPRDDLRALGWL
jgi:hypothetical protein